MNTSRLHRSLGFTFPILALILVLGLLVGCNGFKEPFVLPDESDKETSTTENGSATEDVSGDESADEPTDSDGASAEDDTADTSSEPTDSKDTSAENDSTDAPAEDTSADESTAEEETTGPEMETYTITITNACGTPLSGVYVTIYKNEDSAPSAISGITGADGVYEATIPKGAYHIKAVTTGFSSFAKDAAFEGDAPTLTMILGDHAYNCHCFDTEAETSAVAEPTV